jgi:TolB-like protein
MTPRTIASREISRTSVMTYKSADVPARDCSRAERGRGREAWRVQANAFESTAQLVQVPADTHMRAQSYDEDVQDMLALQSKVARDIAERIQVTLKRQEPRRWWKSKTVNAGALRGLCPPRLCFPK